MRFYIGYIKNGPTWFSGWHVFKSSVKPTPEMYIYSSVVGPFKTKRGALWASKNVGVNPQFQTVADAERIAKKEAGV